ncbi:unconventional myosin-VI-like [Acropora millepora]|uniref:unconventional myosin-VI-like n=1 Tax=Acropora millepora TaxID=45264 RepID=UPI001CF0F2CE|nr:unconventional myosin-VI-like [Acropora millepora]
MDGGKKVWVPDNEQGFRLGEIVDIGSDSITVQVDEPNAKAITAPYDRVFPSEKDNTRDFEDNCSLMFLNEATLLHNLKIRYQKDKIYTYVANILLAVNPYHEVKELYTKERIKQYHGKSLGVLPPHVFAIADKAYRDMRVFKQSQSLIVSGESGAGKTESTKYVLRYLTESWGSGDQGRIEQRIIEANPLLESFGNAKTVRNINSSRFGKYVEVHFNEKVTVVGGFISHYLLEKSRICKQSNGERNYHVFYRLCAGAPQQIKTKLGITKAEDFLYLKQGSIKDKNLDDVADYRRMDDSMNKVGFSDEEKANIFKVIAAVLHVGNISFEDSADKDGGSMVSSKSNKSLNFAAQLLNVSSEELKMSLTTRKMSAGGSDMRVPLKPEQACAARDALAKALYTKLFDHIVSQINQCFPFKTSFTFIGVLDIAGFEYYEFNSFEQFCINYCNEKLQQLFNDRILKQEQELYDKEGLGVKTVTYIDNQDCIDLIEAKKTGIIDILDEESKLPKPTAEHFTRELHQKHKHHFRLALPRKSHLMYHKKMRDDEGFLVRHFAGAVCYQTSEFIEKDNDALHSDLEKLIQDSKDAFLKSLFPGVVQKKTEIGSMTFGGAIKPSSKKLGFISVGSKFRTQLNQLMEKLKNTGASFIRCIKPNGKMIAKDFEGGSILSQLECGGMVAVLTLMQDGWPSRTPFKELYQMYKDHLPSRLARLDPRMFCKALFHALGLDDKDYKFGLSKIFFRPGKFAEFDEIMHSDPENLKNIVSKVLTWLVRTRWRRAIWGTLSVIKLMKKIAYRAAAIIRIQKTVKMFLALCRHKPRYQGIMKIRRLQVQLSHLGKLVGSLKKDQQIIAKDVEGLSKAIDSAVAKIKSTLMKRDAIDALHLDLVGKLNKQLKEVEQRVEQQRIEEEQERLRKIQEQMELERKRREEEERKRKQEEEEKRLRLEIEARRKQEEEEQRKREEEERKIREKEEADRKLQAMRAAEEQKAREEEQRRLAMIEQERRDRELALRLAQDPEALDAEAQQAPQLPLQRALTQSKEKKKHDLTSWKYAELRDTINTSCDIELLEACRQEFHRRLKVYHQWKKQNKARVVDPQGASQRAPQEIMQTAEGAPPLPPRPDKQEPVTPPALPPRRAQRFFRVPFMRRTNQYRETEFKKQGWWYAHFDGQWIARQMEVFPGRPALLLMAGEDDLDMCELSLDETRLAMRQGAEITMRDFEIEWQRNGGAQRDYQAKMYQTFE